MARRVAVCLFLSLALTSCTEVLTEFKASYSGGDGLSIADGPTGRDSITFIIEAKDIASAGSTLYARPRSTILKLPGYLPILPNAVYERANAFTINFKLPQDMVKGAKFGSPGGLTVHGELLIPIETGVLSFAGVEYYFPGKSTVLVELTPAFSGPVTGLLKQLFRSLGSLYSAR